jgi:hypothetical protein
MGFDGIRDLKITRRLGVGSGESAGCVGGRGDSGRALHHSDEFPQVVSFERWSTEVHGNPRRFPRSQLRDQYQLIKTPVSRRLRFGITRRSCDWCVPFVSCWLK